MNIPTPAAVKKQTDARKAREAELASSLANAKGKIPPTKGSSKPFSKRETNIASVPSASSPKGKGSRDRSSGTSKISTSSTSMSSTRKTTTNSSKDGRKVENSTSTTKRKNSSTKSSVNAKSVAPEAKKPFVRPDHLTQRPLRDNEDLQKLRSQLEHPAQGQFKREYRVGGRRSGKTQGTQIKKENS